MAVSWIYRVVLAMCLLGLAGVNAEGAKEFKGLVRDVFTTHNGLLFSHQVTPLIERMIALIESGDVPAEVQGKINLEYLKSLLNNCSIDDCSNETILSKYRSLHVHVRGASNLNNYLATCKSSILRECSTDVYKRAKEIYKLDNQTSTIVEALIKEVEIAFRSTMSGRHSSVEDEFIYDFHWIVLKALKRIDPVESKEITNKWINKGKSLREFMDKVRTACVTAVEHIDPMVGLWPSYHPLYDSDYASSMLPKLSYILKTCRKVVNEWDEIVKLAREDYTQYLVDQKPPKPRYHYSSNRDSSSPAVFMGVVAFGAAG